MTATALEHWATWSTVATAAFTALIATTALVTAIVAIRTLRASRTASEAATMAAEAAREANEQYRRDSRERTRPYVFVELLPSLTGPANWDLRIANSGQTSARNLVLDSNAWPESPDDITTSLQGLFRTPRTLPPGCQIRAIWRLTGRFTDGTSVAGSAESASISVSYESDDPESPVYQDCFDISSLTIGYTPAGETGPTPEGLQGDARKFYVLGQALVRRVAELAR